MYLSIKKTNVIIIINFPELLELFFFFPESLVDAYGGKILSM